MANLTPETLFAPVLYSERLTYTLYKETDSDFVIHVFNTDFPGGGSDNGVWTQADVKRLMVNLVLRPFDTHGRFSKNPGVYIVHLGQTAWKPIGVINLSRRSSQIPPDLGFALLPEYQCQGYGSEAAKRLMHYWKDEFGIKKICGVTSHDDMASQKLLTKIGLKENGWVMFSGTRELAFTLPGMSKFEGQEFSFWGEEPEF